MKIEKLELLKNKVVEVNIPEVGKYRGFLTYIPNMDNNEDKGFYSVKIIDVTTGCFDIDQNVSVAEGDEKYITQSDKPKLMKVRRKSWHYRLVKYVLADSAPTPETMKNGCPYYWLLMFSFIACGFKAIGQILWFILKGFGNIFVWIIEGMASNWINNLNDLEAYGYHEKSNTRPIIYKAYLNNSNVNLLERYIKQNYGHDYGTTGYYDTITLLRAKFNKWDQERAEEQDRLNDIAYRSRTEHEKKRAESKQKWEAKMQPFNDGINNIFESISNGWDKAKSQKNLIRRTKQFFGFIITLFLLGVSYFVVSILTALLTLVTSACILGWTYILMFIAAVIILLAMYFLCVFIGNWLQTIVSKYKMGRKLWYVEPLIWCVWYPVKYIALGIFYLALYIIYVPLKFFFWTFLSKFIVWNLCKFIALLGIGIVKIIVSSTGIFGEYFGASYSDYCPGIEWEGFDDDEPSK